MEPIVFYRSCLLDTGVTFTPVQVPSDSISSPCICLHDAIKKCHAGVTDTSASSLQCSHHHHHLSLSCHRAHKASATVLQQCRSCAFFLTTASSNSFSDVLCHVALGRPLLRLPSGIQKSPVLLMDVLSFQRMCPINRHFLRVISTMMFS